MIFAYHGYPSLIHRLTYRRTNHDNIHVRGYKEEGTTTTPFDMVMLNDLDRFHLVMDVIDRVPGLAERAAPRCASEMVDERLRHRAYTREHGEDPPDVSDWSWPGAALGAAQAARPSVRVLVVNAGSSSLKLTLLDGDDEMHRRRASCTRRARRWTRDELRDGAGRRRCGEADASGIASCTAASASARRCGSTPPSSAELRALDASSRRCTSRSRSPRSTRSARRCPDLPAVACFDTAFHATPPGGRVHLRAAGAMARALGPAPLRLPRALPRLGRAARAGAAADASRRGCGSSAAISGAGASLCAIADGALAATRRWASRRSRGS